MKKLVLWLLAAVVATGAFMSCAHRGADEGSAEAVVERVWQFGQSHPDGFTLDVRAMQEPAEGIAVSYAATQHSHSRARLAFVVQHALGHDGYVGGWLDTESGLYYFDSVRLFPEDQLDAALAFARENGQTAVYVISTGEEIRLEEMQIAA